MQCAQMVPDRTKTGRIKKPNTFSQCEGKLEIRAVVMLDIEAGSYSEDEEGVVMLDDIQFSHLNDELDGKPVDIEADFTVTCAECSYHYDSRFTDRLMQRVGLQPIGNAERTLGTRGGISAA